MRISKGLKQGYDLQDLALGTAVSVGKSALSEREKASLLPGLVRSWEIATERVRILRNRPLPGSMKPKAAKPTQRRRMFESPLEYVPASEGADLTDGSSGDEVAKGAVNLDAHDSHP